MTQDEFKSQIGRLDSEWKDLFGIEKLKIIWDKWKEEDIFFFGDMITWIIENSRRRPVPADFKEAFKETRQAHEKIRVSKHSQQKRDNTKVAENFMNSEETQERLSPEKVSQDIKTMFANWDREAAQTTDAEVRKGSAVVKDGQGEGGREPGIEG